MSTQIHIDSTFRNRSEWPNPADFEIYSGITKSWRTIDRTIQAVRPHDKLQATNLLHTVRLLHLTLPATGVGTVLTNATFVSTATVGVNAFNGPFVTTATTGVGNLPFVYVAFHSTRFRDDKLMNTMEGGLNSYNKSLKEAVFTAYLDKITLQTNSTIPMWYHYKTHMIQSYRINTDDDMHFRVFDNTGNVIFITDTTPPTFPNASQQVNALFELTPYVRDEAYHSHLVSLYNMNT